MPELRTWKEGDAYCGTALEAINYALDASTGDGEWFGSSERMDFLEAWREGNLSEWPEFQFVPQA
jgi:hypothetical protein